MVSSTLLCLGTLSIFGGFAAAQNLPDGVPPDQLCSLGEFSVGPDALTNVFGRPIPRTCIDVPFDNEGAAAERCYYTYVPASCSSLDQSVPLVLDVHGAGACPLIQSLLSGWVQKAEQECFILVWPVGNIAGVGNNYASNCFDIPGLLTSEDYGTTGGNDVITRPCCCQEATDRRDLQMRDGRLLYETSDTLFLKMAIDNLLDTFAEGASETTALSIDPSRVYMGGVSNGCMASLSMAALYSDTIAAVCCHAGALITPFPSDYEPVPIWMVHGVEDTIIEYNGESQTTPAGKFGFWSIEQTQEYLSETNDCSEEHVSDVADGEGAIIGTVFKGKKCKKHGVVEVVSLFESGHVPYLTPFYDPIYGGLPTTIDTTALAWDFCSSHSKKKPKSSKSSKKSSESKSSKKSKNRA